MSIDIPNHTQPTDRVHSGGQPSEDQIRAFKDAGVDLVINMRPEEEMEFDEQALVHELGMRYLHLPIAGPPDLGEAAQAELAKALEDPKGDVVMHCASGNRCGALYALMSRHIHGKEPEEALEAGRAAGLTKLEPYVRSVLDV